VIVAVTIVGMVQAAIDQVINMVAVWHRRVATIRPAAAGARDRRADSGVGFADFEHVLIVMIFVRAVQMTPVQVANMVAMLHAQVTAIGAVNVGMVGMGGVGHGEISF
jgi:hypothetical protein